MTHAPNIQATWTCKKQMLTIFIMVITKHTVSGTINSFIAEPNSSWYTSSADPPDKVLNLSWNFNFPDQIPCSIQSEMICVNELFGTKLVSTSNRIFPILFNTPEPSILRCR
ncbi:hypothetical protein L195_g032577 [Trifolium pratense]|uniref:Uncharacterized protein n=1 Tax=Trifolium pratense TaxID=57577 RepID=A0A2K3LDK5_TRIPR|nr:hypothetical protein L195_g032577 [Trifolium pratense]